MKRVRTSLILLAALLCVALLPLSVSADPGDPVTSGDWTYKSEAYGESTGVTVVRYTGSGGDLTIPDTLGGEPVIMIEGDAFSGCNGLTSVMIPAGVQYVASNPFSDCPNLERILVSAGNKKYASMNGALIALSFGELVAVPGAVSGNFVVPYAGHNIGAYAFFDCRKLTSVTMPELDYEGYQYQFNGSPFRRCYNLKSIVILDELKKDNYFRVFSNEDCPNLTDIWFSGTQAQWDALGIDHYGNERLDSVKMHCDCNEEKQEGDWKYTAADGRATVTGYTGGWKNNIAIPGTLGGFPVTRIGNNAFEQCMAFFGDVTIPSGVTSIGYKAFFMCYTMQNLTIPDGVTGIEELAFGNCTKLKEIHLPDSLTYFGKDAFQNLRSVPSITIPKGVASIEKTSYTSLVLNCGVLTSITVAEDNPVYRDVDGVLFDREMTRLIRYPSGRDATFYEVPEGVQRIGGGAFYLAAYLVEDHLESITIPLSVRSIEGAAFSGRSALTDVCYPGTDEQWNEIVIGDSNDVLIGARHYQIGGEPVELIGVTNSIVNGEKVSTVSIVCQSGVKATVYGACYQEGRLMNVVPLTLHAGFNKLSVVRGDADRVRFFAVNTDFIPFCEPKDAPE